MGSGEAIARSGRGPSSWAIRTVPLRALLLVLAVDALAVIVPVADVAAAGPAVDQDEVLLGLLLGLVAIVHTEISLNAERLRRRIAGTRFVNMTSVWTFAAALVLPPAAGTAVVLAVYLHLYLRVSRHAGVPPHRHVFSTATMILAVHAGTAVRILVLGPDADLASTRGAYALLAALAAFTVVNTLLVVSVLWLSRPGQRFWRILLGGEVLLELATLSLGALVALTVTTTTPWLALLAVLPLLVLEQATLVRQLEAQVDLDTKTGLLNPAAWRWRTDRALDRFRHSDRTTAVLILDLDHFKSVNDRYGHLAGDDVLRAVSGVLLDEVRDHDLAGRFGGEEFVVTVVGLRPTGATTQARDIAERIRRRVEGLTVDSDTAGRLTGLSVSIGVATSREHGHDADALLAAADSVLYEAKRGGRNQVRVGAAGPPEQQTGSAVQ